MRKVQEYVMKREEVPDCWLQTKSSGFPLLSKSRKQLLSTPLTLTPYDITNHLVDELMEMEMDVDAISSDFRLKPFDEDQSGLGGEGEIEQVIFQC